VLDAAGDEVAASGRLERLGRAPYRQIVGLGAAGRVNDFGRIGVD
jgi:hypothetical protein